MFYCPAQYDPAHPSCMIIDVSVLGASEPVVSLCELNLQFDPHHTFSPMIGHESGDKAPVVPTYEAYINYVFLDRQENGRCTIGLTALGGSIIKTVEVSTAFLAQHHIDCKPSSAFAA